MTTECYHVIADKLENRALGSDNILVFLLGTVLSP